MNNVNIQLERPTPAEGLAMSPYLGCVYDQDDVLGAIEEFKEYVEVLDPREDLAMMTKGYANANNGPGPRARAGRHSWFDRATPTPPLLPLFLIPSILPLRAEHPLERVARIQN